MSARYVLVSLPDETPISWDVPLMDVEVSTALSGPTLMKATISFERQELLPYLQPYGGAIWVDDGSGELYGGIITDVEVSDYTLSLTISGYADYPTGQPWTASQSQHIQVDPLDMVRKIWGRIQSLEGGDLHLEVDDTRSKVRIGEEEKDTNFETSDGTQVSFTSGPYKLNYWDVSDLGKALSDLFTEANASYLERHFLDYDTDELTHRLDIQCPPRSVDRTRDRFVIGENVIALPKVTLGLDGYASEVLVLGAGEGSEAVYATAPSTPTRLRRNVVYVDKTATSKKKAQSVANKQLKLRRGDSEQISELRVLSHPNADIRYIYPGDVIRVVGDTEWIDIDTKVRVTEKSWNPETPEEGTLKVEVM